MPGREEGINISSNDVIGKVTEKNPHTDIIYAKDLDEAEHLARAKVNDFDIMLVIGAGDADVLAKKLVA